MVPGPPGGMAATQQFIRINFRQMSLLKLWFRRGQLAIRLVRQFARILAETICEIYSYLIAQESLPSTSTG